MDSHQQELLNTMIFLDWAHDVFSDHILELLGSECHLRTTSRPLSSRECLVSANGIRVGVMYVNCRPQLVGNGMTSPLSPSSSTT